MATDLAPIYLDDARVQLQGDPRPKVAKIVAAGGKSTGQVRVVRLAAIGDETGEALQLDDVIDRAQQRAPVYLRSITHETKAGEVGMEALRADEATGIGNKPRPGTQFGAGRPGMAGQGAKGSPGKLPLDKQAKSDYAPEPRPGGAPFYRDADVGSRGLDVEDPGVLDSSGPSSSGGRLGQRPKRPAERSNASDQSASQSEAAD